MINYLDYDGDVHLNQSGVRNSEVLRTGREERAAIRVMRKGNMP